MKKETAHCKGPLDAEKLVDCPSVPATVEVTVVTLVEETAEEPEPSAEAQIPLEELNLSVRAYNCLKRAQVNSVSDLMGFSYEDLLEIKNFGSKSADEVIEALERIGISIPQSRTSA